MSSFEHHHAMCNRYVGRAVVIGTRDGQTHRGVIQGVRNNKVYLQPIGNQRNSRGIGFGFGIGYGGGWAFGLGIAIGSIVTLALLPFFFF
ncbi:hypothetical protein [Sporosarcina cyprini]|uniref:hypothetical protein n=1 Tax=Sporosarcina cyprini TaxID=2910523 RepID=UPI001EDD2ED9|nr:hypothetical protein [Sporosarcina cyprini]MCG3089775.1 hypothetical protein [Sporosarcina cyprini]